MGISVCQLSWVFLPVLEGEGEGREVSLEREGKE